MYLLPSQKKLIYRLPFYEPMTVFTDLLIVFFSIWFGRIVQMWFTVKLMEVHFHFSNYFFFIALTASFGAIFHSLNPAYDSIRNVLWKITMLSMAVSIFTLILGTLYYWLPFDKVQWVKWIIFVLIVPIILWFYVDTQLMNAVKLYIPSALFVVIIMAYGWLGKGDEGAALLMAGLLVNLFGASFLVTKIGFHQHFNHNDIFHIIQIGGLVLMYRGVMLITNHGMK